MNLKNSLLTIALPILLLSMSASSPVVTDSWSVKYGTPPKTGTQTTKVTVTYEDSLGKKQTATVEATTAVTPGMTDVDKMAAVKSKLNDAAAKGAIGGAPLISMSGGGELMTVTPAANTTNFTNVKITKVSTDDHATGEKDIARPPAGSPADVWVTIQLSGTMTDERSTLDVTAQPTLGAPVNFAIPISPGVNQTQIITTLMTNLGSIQGLVVRMVPDFGRNTLMVELATSENYIGIGSTNLGLGVEVGVSVP